MVEGSARNRSLGSARSGALPEEAVELDDVPAAVVCAHCGRGDCLGACVETTQASQVFAIVPWERPGANGWSRLWSTARLATLKHDSFFGSLPGGDLAPALKFAFAAELVALTLHTLLLAAVASVLFPELPRAVSASARLQLWLGRAVLVGLPVAATGMVGLHLLHGLGLDLGARMVGGRSRQGLRFGGYSCGWDLVTLPLGLLLTALSAGPGAALRAMTLGVLVPRRAGAAYLRGVHHLEGSALSRALLVGGLLPAAALFAGLVLGLGGWLAWLALR